MEVVNFSCTQDGPCTWGQPWTLPGINILSYNITVMQGKVLELIITNNTFWQYCPKTIEGFSEYNITVAAVSDVGIGKSQTKTSELNPSEDATTCIQQLTSYTHYYKINRLKNKL